MIKTVKVSLTILMACIFSVSMALAADQERKRDPDPKKDGSCQSLVINQDAGFDMAANQKRSGGGKGDTKRLKDGTCQTLFTNQDAGFDMAANQKRSGGGKGDTKKDGTCLG